MDAISTDKAPKAIGPYSQAIRCGSWLFLSGQIPLDPATGNVVAGGIAEQTERVLKNIEGVLGAKQLNFKHVIKTTIFLSDMNTFGTVNEIYGKYFKEPYPARSTVQVARLPKDVMVEIEVIANMG